MNVRKIKSWLRENGFESDVKKDKYFCYDYPNDCIYISNTFEECDHMDAFLRFIKQLGYKSNLKLRTISFLHELGHAETMDDCSELEFITEHLKNIIETPSPNMFVLNIKAFFYFRLPIEMKATKWAVDYINCCPDVVAELDKLF